MKRKLQKFKPPSVNEITIPFMNQVENFIKTPERKLYSNFHLEKTSTKSVVLYGLVAKHVTTHWEYDESSDYQVHAYRRFSFVVKQGPTEFCIIW